MYVHTYMGDFFYFLIKLGSKSNPTYKIELIRFTKRLMNLVVKYSGKN